MDETVHKGDWKRLIDISKWRLPQLSRNSKEDRIYFLSLFIFFYFFPCSTPMKPSQRIYHIIPYTVRLRSFLLDLTDALPVAAAAHTQLKHTHTHTHFFSELNSGDSICTQQRIKALLEWIALFKHASYFRKLLGCELTCPDQTFDGWFLLLSFCCDNVCSLLTLQIIQSPSCVIC